MVLNLFSELTVFAVSIGSFLTSKTANSLTFQVFVEVKWEDVCEASRTVPCVQLPCSDLLIASILPGAVCCGYLLYVLSRVYCLIFWIRPEAPHGRMRSFYFRRNFTVRGRAHAAQWLAPKVPFYPSYFLASFKAQNTGHHLLIVQHPPDTVSHALSH